ncbi:MAG: methyltransferase domain-containing protein, partial [bacterium]|nr:methyltransferase domain-containing protein [bacterium]
NLLDNYKVTLLHLELESTLNLKVNIMINNRWIAAQKYEKDWWDIRKKQIDFGFYRFYAEELIKSIHGIIDISANTSLLEIGSGAGGIVTYLNSDKRHAIDPLEEYYSSVPEFQKQRDQKVKYQTGKAENIPFDKKRFDFIICDNVLDHCDDIDKVFSEMRRVLRDHGKLWLRLNIYTFWGRLIRLLVEKLKIDPGHPHTFTRKSIKAYFKNYEFEIIKFKEDGFFKTWLKEIASGKIKELLKAITFSTPNKSVFILGKSKV